MDRDRRMENGNGERNRERNIGQVQVKDQGEVYIQREMDRKTDGDRGKNILGTWRWMDAYEWRYGWKDGWRVGWWDGWMYGWMYR